jgi:hypothetical protein
MEGLNGVLWRGSGQGAGLRDGGVISVLLQVTGRRYSWKEGAGVGRG